MKLSYNEVYSFAEYGRVRHGWLTYPVQLCCKELVKQGIKGRLEIYSNNDVNKEGEPDVVYLSIVDASKNANARYTYNDFLVKETV